MLKKFFLLLPLLVFLLTSLSVAEESDPHSILEKQLIGMSFAGYLTNAGYSQNGSAIAVDPGNRLGAGVVYRFKDPLLWGALRWVAEVGYRTSLTDMNYSNLGIATTVKHSSIYLNNLRPINDWFFWGFGVNISTMSFSWLASSSTDKSLPGYQLFLGWAKDNLHVRLEYFIEKGAATGINDSMSGLLLTTSVKLF
ncbi:MAG: hypothetical protein ABIE84_06465 [bacterium]